MYYLSCTKCGARTERSIRQKRVTCSNCRKEGMKKREKINKKKKPKKTYYEPYKDVFWIEAENRVTMFEAKKFTR